MVIFYKKWKKYNKIQLTKSKMDLNIRKMTNHPPSPGTQILNNSTIQNTQSSRYFWHVSYKTAGSVRRLMLRYTLIHPKEICICNSDKILPGKTQRLGDHR